MSARVLFALYLLFQTLHTEKRSVRLFRLLGAAKIGQHSVHFGYFLETS